MKIKRKLSGHGGFTLLEVLVTMTIILILAGLILPVIGIIIKRADLAQARMDVHTLYTAIKSYESEYTSLPIGDSESIVRCLLGDHTGPIRNPRKKQFFECGRADVASGTFHDPWGRQYEIRVDDNYDGWVDGRRVRAIVRSLGPDGVKSNDDVISEMKFSGKFV